jgi:hypothetical protein
MYGSSCSCTMPLVCARSDAAAASHGQLGSCHALLSTLLLQLLT